MVCCHDNRQQIYKWLGPGPLPKYKWPAQHMDGLDPLLNVMSYLHTQYGDEAEDVVHDLLKKGNTLVNLLPRVCRVRCRCWPNFSLRWTPLTHLTRTMPSIEVYSMKRKNLTASYMSIADTVNIRAMTPMRKRLPRMETPLLSLHAPAPGQQTFHRRAACSKQLWAWTPKTLNTLERIENYAATSCCGVGILLISSKLPSRGILNRRK